MAEAALLHVVQALQRNQEKLSTNLRAMQDQHQAALLALGAQQQAQTAQHAEILRQLQ